jgi:hypothetical protein
MNYASPIRTITHQPDKNASKPEPGKAATAEKVKPAETIHIPAALLLAGEIVSPKSDPKRPYLQGIYLHATEGTGRGCPATIRMVPSDNQDG